MGLLVKDKKAVNFPKGVIFGNPVILQEGVGVITDKDLEQGEFFIKREPGGKYQSLKKWNYEPCTTRGKIGSGDKVIVKSSLKEIGEAVEEGVYPRPKYVSEDYFKFHWNSRERRSGSGEARINHEAKWPDGKYKIKMEASDIGGKKSSLEKEKILDNFLPYVQEVKIEQGGRRYCGRWPEEPLSEEKLAEELTVVEDDVFGAGELVFRIRFSEAMDGRIKPSGIYFTTEGGEEVGLEFETWQRN